MYKSEKGNDWELRKRLRLKQVRQQSREFALELRAKVVNEQKMKLKEIEHTKQAEHSKWKSKTLNEINKEYIECLKNIGTAHQNALEDKCAPFQERKEKPGQHKNVDFSHNIIDKPEKLLPAVIIPTKIAPVASKPKYKKSTASISSKKMKNKEKGHKNTQTENYVSLQEPVNLDEYATSKLIDPNTSTAQQNTVQENKENESIPPKFVIQPHFSEISNLLKKSSQSTVRYLEEENENDKLSGFDSKPHFSQISNLLKKHAVSQNIEQKNDEINKTDPESHFSQVSDLLKQRRNSQAQTSICGSQTLPKETNELKRRPSVVSFKSVKDSGLLTGTTGETYRQSTYAKNQSNPFATCDGSRQLAVDSKVQMYDNRTKFTKEYIPQQPLTQRTSTNRDSPNAMELANEENERMRAHINSLDDRLKKDLERGINATEREKLMRKYKSLLNELELLSTEEKTLKGYIQAHQPFQNESKMQNTRQFLEKRTIITSSEILKHNSNYINVASIKGTTSNQSDDSRKSIVLDYEESLILDNLSETKVNSNDTHRFSNKASPTLSRKLAKESETQTSVRDAPVETVQIPTIASNGKKFYGVPLKITIQIQPSDRQESLVITPKETNLRLSQLESNSSSLTEYRGLPKTFTGSSRPLTEQILTGMAKPQQFRNPYETNKQIVKKAELEGYIRRLLQMSKESVDELPSVSDVPSIQESIIDVTGKADNLKFSEQNKKTSEISSQIGNEVWQKNGFEFSTFSKSSMTSETSSISTRKSAKVSILKAASCSILSSSSENGCDLSEQFDALTQNCNQRIIELTNLMSKVRIERQQILEQTSLSSGTANMPNNSTEYHELPSRLLLFPQKLPSPPIERHQPNKKFHDLSTIIEMGPPNAQLELKKRLPLNVSKIINEVFTKPSSDPKIDVVPYQSEEKLEETNASEGSLIDIYAELKRRDLVPMGLKKLMESNVDSQSTELLHSLNGNESVCTRTTESLLGFSDVNRRSLLAHSLSSNPKTPSSTSSASQPALNLKEFLERELTKKNNSSDSGSSSNLGNTELGHRTSTPVTKYSSSKSFYLSIDAQSNLFSAESQISSVKSDTTTSNWDSA